MILSKDLFFLILDKKYIQENNTPATLRVYSNGVLMDEIKTNFVDRYYTNRLESQLILHFLFIHLMKIHWGHKLVFFAVSFMLFILGMGW